MGSVELSPVAACLLAPFCGFEGLSDESSNRVPALGLVGHGRYEDLSERTPSSVPPPEPSHALTNAVWPQGDVVRRSFGVTDAPRSVRTLALD